MVKNKKNEVSSPVLIKIKLEDKKKRSEGPYIPPKINNIMLAVFSRNVMQRFLISKKIEK